MCTGQVGKSLTVAKAEGSGGLRKSKYLKALKIVLGDMARIEKVNKNLLKDTQMAPPKPRDLIISAKYRGGEETAAKHLNCREVLTQRARTGFQRQGPNASRWVQWTSGMFCT